MQRFSPQRCLVTGAAGFILSHTVDRLLNEFPHCFVIAYDVMDYCASEKNLESAIATGRCRLIRGDIRNMGLVLHVLRSERIDSVIHGAACSHVCHSFNNSLQFTDVNVRGTHVMLEATRRYNTEEQAVGRHGVKRFLFTNTDEVYGSNTHQCDEKSLLVPTNPYAASKMCCAALCSAYIKSYGLPIIESRGNNVYGPRQFYDKVVPRFCGILMAKGQLPIHGNGEQLRSFMSVYDTAAALVAMLTRGHVHEIYNIESSDEITVLELAQRLLTEFGVSEEEHKLYLQFVRDRPFNDQRYWVDGSKLRQHTGFQPKVPLKSGLAETVAWYKAHEDHWPYSREMALDPEFEAPTIRVE